MNFGTGSITELTQKREGQSTKMHYIRPNIQAGSLPFVLKHITSSFIGERAKRARHYLG